MHKIKLENGKFKFVESYTGLDGKRHRVSVTKNNQTKATEKQAYEELQEKINKKLNKTEVIETVGYYIDEFFKFKKNTISKNTYNAYNTSLRVLDRNLTVDLLDKKTIEKELIQLKEIYKPNNIKLIKTTFNVFFKFIKDYYIPDFNLNVKFILSKEDKQKELQKIKYIETNKINDILGKITHQITKDFVTVQLLTGLRAGELLALTPKDVYNKLITISKTRHPDGSITAPKTMTSNRKIEINDKVLNILSLYISNNKFIFTTSLSTINRHLRPHNLSTHMFRHTHVALLIEAGVPIKVISERLGHSNIQTTLNIYTHVTDNMRIDLKEKLEKLGTF